MPIAPTLLATLLAAPQDAAAAPSFPARGRNLLVITLDTARRDFMGFMGRTPSPTPHLDGLARESVVFDDAYTVAPLTLPAHASLFTGLYPRSHGVHENSAFKVPSGARTLAEVLRDHGYATGAAVGAFVLDAMFGLDQGFQSYDAPEVTGAGHVLRTQRPAVAVIDRALEDLARLARTPPFFYWIHLYDPHFPYLRPDVPPPLPTFVVDGDRYARMMYEEEIRYSDLQIGRLLAALRRHAILDDLVILFASDHGESLRDAPEGSHGFFLFDSTVRIPMFLRAPGLAPRRVAAQVSLVDVMPTLLPLLGPAGIAEPDLQFDGVDLAALMTGEASDPPDRAILLESWYAWLNHGWAPFDGCVQGPLKHLRSHRLELFDRAADPEEKRNVFDPEEPRSRLLARRLDDLVANPATRLERDALSLSGRDLARLKAMGYAAAAARTDDPPDGSTLPDVYGKIEVIQAMEEVVQAGALQDTAREIELLRGLVVQEPQSASLREALGILLVKAGPEHFDEAERNLRSAIRIEPKSSRSHFALGRLFHQRADAVRDEIRRRREQGEERDALREALAEERRLARRAMRSYRTTIEFEPDYPDAIERLARMLTEDADRSARAGELEEARAGLKEADELFGRWLGFMPEAHPERPQIEKNRAWLQKRRAELEGER